MCSSKQQQPDSKFTLASDLQDSTEKYKQVFTSADVLYVTTSNANGLVGGGTDLVADLGQVLTEATTLEQLLNPGRRKVLYYFLHLM